MKERSCFVSQSDEDTPLKGRCLQSEKQFSTKDQIFYIFYHILSRLQIICIYFGAFNSKKRFSVNENILRSLFKFFGVDKYCRTWKLLYRPLPREVTSPHTPPAHPREVQCIGFTRVWSLCLASRNNMASNEEGSTHTRTIQKRAKKTQDQACQFDASLLEGERWLEIFVDTM